MRPDGCQAPPRSTPSGSATHRPSEVCTCTDTTTEDSSPLSRLAKNRSVGSASPTQTGGVVAVEPTGSCSEYASPFAFTDDGSLPETTFAPPVSAQPAVPFSNVATFL